MPNITLVRAAVLGLFAARLAACTAGGADATLSAAKGHLARGDTAAATIELKNAIAAQPTSGEARFLLGRALLAEEKSAGAIIEFERARELQHPEDEVVPLLARALLLSNEPSKAALLPLRVRLTDPRAKAQLMTVVAQAFTQLGEREQAEQAVAIAIQADPVLTEALLTRARLQAGGGDVGAAMLTVSEVLSRHGNDADALTLKGRLLEVGSDNVGAEQSYRAALAAKPAHADASGALMNLLLRTDQLQQAAIFLQKLVAARPGHPSTLYFQALEAMGRGDHGKAYELSRDLVAKLPKRADMLQLAGAAALRHGRYAEAEQHLGKLLQLLPNDVPAREMLARAALRVGKPERVLLALEPLVQRPDVSPHALALAAHAQLLMGNDRAADDLLARASQRNHRTSQTALTLSALERGDATAPGRLEQIASADPSTVADLALITAAYRRTDLDGALQAIDRMAAKQPGEPQPWHLRGQVLARRGDKAGARTAYEKALSLSGSYFAAIDGLAALDLGENKVAAARARFEVLLAKDPSHTDALTALALLDEKAGKPTEAVTALLQRAVASNPLDAQARRRLIVYQLDKQDFRQALTSANDAATALPESPEVLEALASAQYAAGNKNQALTVVTKLVSLAPRSAEAQLALFKAALMVGDATVAERALRQALELSNGAAGVVQRAAGLYVLSGSHDKALHLARALQADKKQTVLGMDLVGDIEASRKAWPAAAAAYRDALKLQASTPRALRLHSTLLASERTQADAFAAEWVKTHPKDVEFLFHLGGLALQAKDFGAAEGWYAQVLKVHPDHAMALNNMAWSLHAQRKPEALAKARRANELLPEIPAIMDTLAVLLADGNELTQALALQKRAVALAPSSPTLRLTLARLQLKAGDKPAARAELQRLQQLGNSFTSQTEVAELIAKT